MKDKREFNRVYKNAKVFHTPFFVLFYLREDIKKVAFVASKKVGKAIKRNRAKRLLRAMILPHITDLKDGYYILVAKPALLESEFNKAQKSLYQIFKKAKLL